MNRSNGSGGLNAAMNCLAPGDSQHPFWKGSLWNWAVPNLCSVAGCK